MYVFLYCVFFTLVMNGYRYYEISVDGLYADSSYKDDAAKIDWPVFQLSNSLQQIAYMKLLEAEIPYSFYPFNTSNNTFNFSDTGGSYVATIPAGQYTITTLAAALSASLNALTTLAPPGAVYSTSFNNQTQKLEITSQAGDFSFTFGTSADKGDTNPRLLLGFNAGASNSFNKVLIGNNVASITGPNYLYVNSASLGPLFNMYATSSEPSSEGGLGPHLAKIPINSNPGGLITWKDPCPQQWFDMENLNILQRFDFFLTLGGTQTEKPLKMNGQPFSLKFGVLVVDGSLDSSERLNAKRVRRA